MPLTIREIVRIPNLRTRIVAGRRGEGREVRWAGVCELPDPTEWLGEGDLLMTIGLAIPEGPDAQREWIELLAGSGLSGLALCESGSSPGAGMRSPPLTPALRKSADRLGFPVLMVEHQVPFVALAHAVMDASSRSEHERLVKVMRLYESLRSSRAGSASAPATLAVLAQTCGCDLFVVDRRTLRPPFGGWPELRPGVASALADVLAERTDPLPAWIRFDASPAQAMALVIPTEHAEVMVAVGLGEPLDPLLLQHTATIVAVEVERSAAERERARRLGGDLFRRMVEGRVGAETATALMQEHRCGTSPWIVAATGAGRSWPEIGTVDLHARLDAAGTQCLELELGDALYTLIEDSPSAKETLAELAAEVGGVGLSRPFADLETVGEAVRDARWALGAAVDSRVAVVDQTHDPDQLVAPRSVAEAEFLVERVLGPLRTYDRSHRSDLEQTLQVFLEENRSWQRAAERLHVHKQTLVYRIRQVETLTGRDLSRTGDVARLWLALEASQRLVVA
jgi:purine catabolism regulator